jgi:hypothetical protein
MWRGLVHDDQQCGRPLSDLGFSSWRITPWLWCAMDAVGDPRAVAAAGTPPVRALRVVAATPAPGRPSITVPERWHVPMLTR